MLTITSSRMHRFSLYHLRLGHFSRDHQRENLFSVATTDDSQGDGGDGRGRGKQFMQMHFYTSTQTALPSDNVTRNSSVSLCRSPISNHFGANFRETIRRKKV